MGNNNSIKIEEKKDGIYKVIVKDFPKYPIVYLRLCKDIETDEYFIAEDCDVSKKYELHRKILIVGFRILDKDDIYEQAFYLSSGLNSIEILQTFFNLKFTFTDEKDTTQLWLPFSGFGYSRSSLKNVKDLETNIKLIKDYFDCSPFHKTNCLYGRFGNKDPNFMQISYCLGGKFWNNNIDIFKIYNIQKIPTLFEYLTKITSHFMNFKDDIECSLYLNNYIGYAIPQNYSPGFLKQKKEALKKYETKEWYNPNIKYDYRILNILQKKGFLNFGTIALYNNEEKIIVKISLPFEHYFFGYNTWDNYLLLIDKLYTRYKDDFIKYVVPIIEEEGKIFEILYSGVDIIEEKKPKLGTFENPFEKREDAKVGDYYLRGKKPVKRNV